MSNATAVQIYSLLAVLVLGLTAAVRTAGMCPPVIAAELNSSCQKCTAVPYYIVGIAATRATDTSHKLNMSFNK